MAKERGADYERLAELIDSGAVTPALQRSYPLDQALLAVRLLETGQVRGKVAITV